MFLARQLFHINKYIKSIKRIRLVIYGNYLCISNIASNKFSM